MFASSVDPLIAYARSELLRLTACKAVAKWINGGGPDIIASQHRQLFDLKS